MRLVLLFLLPLALAFSPLFSRTDTNECDYTRTGSRYFWLSNVTYESHLVYSTPAHLAVSYANLTFDLQNNFAANAWCTGTNQGGPSESYFYWPQVHKCIDDPGATGNTTWTYLGYNKNLQVNETWTCGHHTYLATGNATLNFECKTSEWTNPNYTWPNTGDLYRTKEVTCGPISVPINFPSIVRLD